MLIQYREPYSEQCLYVTDNAIVNNANTVQRTVKMIFYEAIQKET